MATTASGAQPIPWVKVHPAVVRLTHWINVLAFLVMVASGWRIYNASPLFDFRFPKDLTLGGWLGGALQWHFAAMWLLALNGLVYLFYGILSVRLRQKLFSIQLRGIVQDVFDMLRGRFEYDDQSGLYAARRAASIRLLFVPCELM